MVLDLFKKKRLKNKNCEGCILYNKACKLKDYQDANEIANNCPCGSCLVKMRCQKICEELVNYSWWTYRQQRDKYGPYKYRK